MSQAENPFRYLLSSPEVIRLVVLIYVRFPLSLRNVEDLLFERGIGLGHETVRLWWHWRWHVDEVYVRINRRYIISGAVDHEVLESRSK